MSAQGLAKAVNAARLGVGTADQLRYPFADRLDGRLNKKNFVDEAFGQAEGGASDPQAFALLGAKAIFEQKLDPLGMIRQQPIRHDTLGADAKNARVTARSPKQSQHRLRCV